MKNKITGKNDFQLNVLKAVDLIANIVTATLGPNGLPVLLEREGQPPLSTKDGVTVANSISVADPEIDLIIQSIKEASMNTNSIAGDGTTTAILLTQAFIKESMVYLKTGAITPQKLGDDILEITKKIVEGLEKISIKVDELPEKIKDIAFISSNGDQAIADIVFEAIDNVGVDGVVTLNDSTSGETSLEMVQGFSIDRGYGHLGSNGVYLINDEVSQTVNYDNPKIILYDGIADDVNDLLGRGISQITCNAQRPTKIVIFAHDFSSSVLSALFANISSGVLHVLPVKIPKLGSQFSQSSVLEDIAALTGGKVLHPSMGTTFKDIQNAQSPYLGNSSSVISERNKTFIYDGKGDLNTILARADAIKGELEAAKNEWDKDIIKERLGRLVGGIAYISVAAATDLEAKEKKDRIEDALNATRAALLEGVVPGGGSALLTVFNKFIKDNPEYKNNVVYNIIEKVSHYPLRKIIENGGKESFDVILDKILKLLDENQYVGYDARSNEIRLNMLECGVIDPLKVVKTALSNAASIAAILLRGGGSITNIKEPKDNSNLPNLF